jgi:catechol 2,3-dioxygenase-like lactoylglutathione lyase family enzyme
MATGIPKLFRPDFDAEEGETQMQFHGVMAMVLVQDIERALRFYRDILGFTVAEEEEDWVIFNEGVGLQVSPDPIPATNIAFTAVQVTLQVDNVEAAFAELTKKGVPFLIPPTSSGSASFATFRDTENNMLQLMEL